MKHEEECFIAYPNTEKCVEKTINNINNIITLAQYVLRFKFPFQLTHVR